MVALYFLHYDLRGGQDHQRLYDQLAKANAVRILESLWCFKRVNTTAEELRDHFKQFIDGDDRLSVAEVTQWATHNTLGTPKDIWEHPRISD
ncbi:MAG: hypothetical protein P8186_07440 [Anaerolineae bacterium]